MIGGVGHTQEVLGQKVTVPVVDRCFMEEILVNKEYSFCRTRDSATFSRFLVRNRVGLRTRLRMTISELKLNLSLLILVL